MTQNRPVFMVHRFSFDITLLAKYFGRFQLQRKKFPKIKTSKIFKRPKIFPYSRTTLVSRNKPHMTRKALRMTGIVKAVTKKILSNSCRRFFNHFELQRSYSEQTLDETLLEILTRICLTEFVLFSHRFFFVSLSVNP